MKDFIHYIAPFRNRWVLRAALVVAAGALGFYCGERFRASGMAAGASDYFVFPRSFSEVENAKAVLDGLAKQSLFEWGRHWVASVQDPAGPEPSVAPDPFVRDLEQALVEFEGTQQQFLFAERLLSVLAHQQDLQPWLDLYLKILYTNPGHRLVNTYAPTAVRHAQSLSAEAELLEAFEHRLAIPAAVAAPPESIQLLAAELKVRGAARETLIFARCAPGGIHP